MERTNIGGAYRLLRPMIFRTYHQKLLLIDLEYSFLFSLYTIDGGNTLTISFSQVIHSKINTLCQHYSLSLEGSWPSVASL